LQSKANDAREIARKKADLIDKQKMDKIARANEGECGEEWTDF